ncbi:MAG: efflux RND transporter periplasmic adaptor subunit, partial [Tateyamaria sp.]
MSKKNKSAASLMMSTVLFFTIPATTVTAQEPAVPNTTVAVVALDDDGHEMSKEDDHGHAAESTGAKDGDNHAGEAPDAHGDDDHAGEAADAHADDDHAGEAPGAHGDEGGGDIVKLAPGVAQEAGIVLEQAELGALGESLSLPAEIRFDADRMANVTPKVSGIIDRLLVGEGDTVAYGDTLALITSRELAALKAQWLTAETRKSLAAQSLTRTESLWSQKVTSEATVQTARAELEAAKTASEAAETELHAVGIDHADLEKIAAAPDGNNANAYLIAPLAGTVVRRSITLGETVTAGDSSAKVLFTIVDDSVVWADIAVYKQDISRVRIGAPVALKSDAGDIMAQSTVAFVLPVIDEV